LLSVVEADTAVVILASPRCRFIVRRAYTTSGDIKGRPGLNGYASTTLLEFMKSERVEYPEARYFDTLFSSDPRDPAFRKALVLVSMQEETLTTDISVMLANISISLQKHINDSLVRDGYESVVTVSDIFAYTTPYITANPDLRLLISDDIDFP
ncbi:MAG: hypothetical protein ACYDC8_16910, partial [Gammaproteobacteria bacterium]